jgi:hypothetical protein
VFGDRVLSRIFGPKRAEVTGEWRKLHSGDLHNLYSSSNIIRQIKSRKRRWVEHVAHMEEKKKCTRFWWESQKERDRSEDAGVNGKMGSKSILRRLAERVWSGFTWLRIGTGGRTL